LQALFHLDDLGYLAFHEPRDWDSSPRADDLGDVFFIDLFLQQRVAALEFSQPRLRGLDLLFNLHCLSVSELRGLREICGALCTISFGAHRFELGLEAADLTDDLFLLLPARAQRSPLLRQLGELLLESGEALLGNPVGLLLEGLALDFELADLALDLVQLSRQ